MPNFNTSEEKAHAKFSASGSDRWLNCPGSIALCNGLPPPPESPYAKEGTDAHACFEFALKNRKLNTKKLERLAAKKWDADMVSHALSSRSYVDKLLTELPHAELLIEQKIDSSSFTCEGQFGTVDAAIVDEFNKLVVIDYKYGAGYAVDPENNAQLIYYALGIAQRYQYNFETVDLVIIQPRAHHASGETIRTSSMTIGELARYAKVFKRGVKAAMSPDAPLKSGPWCKWCIGVAICPRIKDDALADAKIDFESLAENDIALPKPEGISDDELSKALFAAEKLSLWVSHIKDVAFHRLLKGGSIAGFKLVEKRGVRKWANEKLVLAKFGDKAKGAPPLLSPAQLEKKLGKAGKAWIKENTVCQSSGYTMVDDSDKRRAVNPVADEFSVIT